MKNVSCCNTKAFPWVVRNAAGYHPRPVAPPAADPFPFVWRVHFSADVQLWSASAKIESCAFFIVKRANNAYLNSLTCMSKAKLGKFLASCKTLKPDQQPFQRFVLSGLQATLRPPTSCTPAAGQSPASSSTEVLRWSKRSSARSDRPSTP